MKQFILKHHKAFAGTVALLLIGGITMSFQDSPFTYSKFSAQEQIEAGGPSTCLDTIPGKNEGMKMKDFDKLQTELDRSMLEVTEEMKKIDLSKIQGQIEASLKSIDMEGIKKSVEASLKDLNLDKIMAEVSASLRDIKPGFKSEEIEKAMQEARKELDGARLSLKEVDQELIKKELESAKKEIEKAKIEISKIDVDKIIAEARQGIDKAKIELRLTREMFVEMEKDGLINAKEGFTLEYKNKDLYIDGKKQPQKVTDKYRKYFKEDDFKITIDKE